MRLRELGLRPVDLAARVYYTHRASSTTGVGLDDVRSYAEKQQGWRALLNDPSATGSPWDGLPLPKRPAAYRPPHELTKWVVAWPAPSYGYVVELTYRQEGQYVPGSSGSYEHPEDVDPPSFAEHDRHPLYVVRSNLRGRGVLVPPWAIYPLGPALVEHGANPPTPIGSERPTPYLHDGVAFVDYAESLAGLLTATVV